MASNISSRSIVSIASSWKQISFNFIRKNFSASSPSSASASASASGSTSNPTIKASKPRWKRKKKNLFEVAQFLPNWGIGYQMAKAHWSGVSYQITKINLYKDGRHGKAWGIVHKNGLPSADAPKKISGVHKRCWKYIPNSKKTEQITSQPHPPSEPQTEAQAA